MTWRDRLDIRPLAEQDIEEAALWYEHQSPGLGLRFAEAVDAALAAIAEGPEHYARVYRDVRRVGVGRFPYALYYVLRDSIIHVIACVHGRRHPRRWQRRAHGL